MNIRIIITFCFFTTVSSKISNSTNERLEPHSDADSPNQMNDEAKRIVLHPDDAVAAEVLRMRAELENTTRIIGSLLSQVADLEKTVQSLKATQLNTTQAHTGATYVRWGKTTCPGDAEIVYHGYFAGRHWNNKGGGTDNLCLPSDPVWGNYSDGYQNYRSAIYGTETDITEIFQNSISQQDMPCAVCKSPKTTSLMIPARKQCYPGWTMEYWGYLVGADVGVNSYEHACLDSNPDFLDHGATDDNQHVVYLAEGHCGSLPCPPYVDGRELTCVVCSK